MKRYDIQYSKIYSTVNNVKLMRTLSEKDCFMNFYILLILKMQIII